MTEADVDEVFDCNVKGTMFSVQACLPALEASGRGRVILTSSITARSRDSPAGRTTERARPRSSVFWRTAAIGLAPKRVTINAVMPGNVMTEGMAELGEVFIRESAAIIPQHRLGSVEDICYAASSVAKNLGVSRLTVRQALAALEVAGVVRRVPGRDGGTFVRRRKVERDLSQVVGVPALLRAQGMTAGSRIVSTGMVAADEETRTALALVAGDYVFDVVLIRLADGTPISLEHARLTAEMFPGLLDLPLGGSLYELLQEQYGTVPGEAVEHIEVAPVGEDEGSILAVELGAALLSITRTTHDSEGRVFEFSHDLFRADRTTITERTPSTRIRGSSGGGRVVQLRPRRKR